MGAPLGFPGAPPPGAPPPGAPQGFPGATPMGAPQGFPGAPPPLGAGGFSRPGASAGGQPGGRTTAAAFLQGIYEAKESEIACLPALTQELKREGFGAPAVWVDSFMGPDSRLFLIGDSVIGQMCELGQPGLCCSPARPCQGAPPFQGNEWVLTMDKMPEYSDRGWQHLRRFKVRTAGGGAFNDAYQVAPEVGKYTKTQKDVDERIVGAVSLIMKFLAQLTPNENDVMVLGMLGNHFNSRLDAFDTYMARLMTDVVNPFPGRVVVMGYSPQHFRGTGSYNGQKSACFPLAPPGDVSAPVNSFRNSLLMYNVWKNLDHPRSRVVDVYELLLPLWSCHRAMGDCTHWEDHVIALQAQLVVNALQKLSMNAS